MGHVNQGGPWDLQRMSKHDLRLQAEVRGVFCYEPYLRSQWGLTSCCGVFHTTHFWVLPTSVTHLSITNNI